MASCLHFAEDMKVGGRVLANNLKWDKCKEDVGALKKILNF